MENTMSSQTCTESRESGPLGRFVRDFLESNYLYVISAGLMIYGCFRLMREAPVDGDEFSRILNGLLLLQGYELLVLGTICLIRKRLPAIEDTLTLVGVEMILLFDPTFFANNFHTMLQGDHSEAGAPWVNVCILALLPLKVRMIEWINGFRLDRWTSLYLFAGAVIVYLAPLWLATTRPALGRSGTFYLICVLTAVVLALPPRTENAIASGRERIRLPRHYRWVPRFFVHFPAVLILSHLCETWFVHKLNLQGAFLAPFLVVLGVRALFRSQGAYHVRAALLDGVSLGALLLSLPSAGLRPPEVFNPAEPFFTGVCPVALTALVLCGVYTAGAILHNRPWLLARPAALVLSGAVAMLWHFGVLAQVFHVLRGIAGWIWLNRLVIEFAVVLTVLGLSVWNRVGGFFVLACIWTMVWAVRFWNLSVADCFPELAQGFLLSLLVGSYLSGERQADRAMRAALVGMILGVGLLRLAAAPLHWSLGLNFGLSTAAIAIGWILRQRAEIVLGVAAAGIAAGIQWHEMLLQLNAPTVFIGASIGCFVLAVYVSFQKEALLRKLATTSGGEHEPSDPMNTPK